MKRPSRVPLLRCYAYPKGNLIYAECIDLAIIVARPTMGEAKRALNDAIRGSVESAAEHGFLDDLLKRRSPWQSRLHYHWIGLLIRLDRLLRRTEVEGGLQPIRFRATCPACTACA